MTKLSSMIDTFQLCNGYRIPCIGYGTWQAPDGETTVKSVKEAVKVGYRHIDTAACYGNEKSVGQGIRESGIDRSQLFITSKVWNTERGYETTLAAFEKSLKDLGVDYLDLYLIHWPASPSQFDDWEKINAETWRAMIQMYKAKKVRAIGVSNFMKHHLRALLEMEVKPMVNQIEFHPGQMQRETVDYCRANGMLIEGFSPLGTGKMLSNPDLKEIAEKYGRSTAQLCIRWALQNGVLPLPKSVTPVRIAENSQVFDFEIAEADMEYINNMPYIGGSGNHPDKVMF